MPAAAMNTMIDRLRQTALSQLQESRTDGQLLAAFVDHKDEAAFAAIVQRHGAMVLSVCDRVVRNHHDAEDAFQAAFLVLARKARSVRPRSMVANWLHGVAYRTACRSRTGFARRQKHEAHLPPRKQPPEQADSLAWGEVRQIIHEELHALSERYRAPP